MNNDTQTYDQQAVINLQTYLRELYLHDPEIPKVEVDGVFGEETKRAVIAFQKKNGLPPTGEVDRTTWNRLYTAYLETMERYTPPRCICVFPRNPVNYELAPGDSYFLVNILQYMLSEISAEHNFDPEVTITGVYDENTERAVMLFQHRNRLEETGRVNRKTWNSIADYFNILQTEYYQ